jgi:tRNA pseudouridine13 synthase
VTSATLNESWAQNALDPPRAAGAPLGSGRLRVEPDDFLVEEHLGFTPAGAGQHVLLKVRKRGANTQWVARELAKVCHCRVMEVGYAGLKDRHAVAIQWFTVPRSAQSLDAWRSERTAEFEVLEAHEHSRKLPRGALTGNSFTIRVRDVTVTEPELAMRMQWLARHGAPNYFGSQRFGREGSNLQRIEAGLGALRPADRGFVLSAARSLIFNAVLAERVREASWNRLEPGDVANLDGRGSVFAVDTLDDELRERCARLDIHPTGPMWGLGGLPTRGRVLELETRMADALSPARGLVEQARVEGQRRSLRLAVRDLDWTRISGSMLIRFRLGRGGFATTVLREIFDTDPGVDEMGSEE